MDSEINVDEDIEEIVERKVMERLKEEKDAIKQQTKKELQNKVEYEDNNGKKEVSRRSFLKKLGLGAAGLGALSLTPTSALNLKDDNFNVYTGTGTNSLTEYFSVNQGGPVQIKNTDLEIKGNNAIHGGNTDNFNITNFQGNNGSSGQILKTDGTNLTWTNPSSGGATIQEEVTSYNDLPVPAPEREFYYVKEDDDVVVPYNENNDLWRSVFSEFNIVAGRFANNQIAFRDALGYDLKTYYPLTGKTVNTGEKGSIICLGDFNGDGTEQIAFKDTETGLVKIYDCVDDSTRYTDLKIDTGVAGDFNGDGSDEIGYWDGDVFYYYNPSNGSRVGRVAKGFGEIIVGDFDGDGTTEIAYEDNSENDMFIHDPANNSVTDTGEATTEIIDSGDFDGDGTDEIIYIYYKSSLKPRQSLAIYDPDTGSWAVIHEAEHNDVTYTAVGDFDRDGEQELAFTENNDDEIRIYDYTDDTKTNTGLKAPTFITAGDFDDDGTDEIAFRDSNDNLKIYDHEDGSTEDTNVETYGAVAGKLRN